MITVETWTQTVVRPVSSDAVVYCQNCGFELSGLTGDANRRDEVIPVLCPASDCTLSEEKKDK